MEEILKLLTKSKIKSLHVFLLRIIFDAYSFYGSYSLI